MPPYVMPHIAGSKRCRRKNCRSFFKYSEKSILLGNGTFMVLFPVANGKRREREGRGREEKTPFWKKVLFSSPQTPPLFPKTFICDSPLIAGSNPCKSPVVLFFFVINALRNGKQRVRIVYILKKGKKNGCLTWIWTKTNWTRISCATVTPSGRPYILQKMAPAAGFEPATKWLTATYSTAELCRSVYHCYDKT